MGRRTPLMTTVTSHETALVFNGGKSSWATILSEEGHSAVTIRALVCVVTLHALSASDWGRRPSFERLPALNSELALGKAPFLFKHKLNCKQEGVFFAQPVYPFRRGCRK